MLHTVHAREYAIIHSSGRNYRIIFGGSGDLCGHWCVCGPSGAFYATFSTLAAARRQAQTA